MLVQEGGLESALKMELYAWGRKVSMGVESGDRAADYGVFAQEGRGVWCELTGIFAL